MPITPFSVVPSRKTPSTFAEDTDTFLSELAGFPAEANALEENVNTKEASAVAASLTAASQAQIATAQAAAAVATVNVEKWVSGTTYAQGDNVWSPVDVKTYRRKVAGGGTTDPSLDPVNWAALSGGSSDLANFTLGII